MLDRLNTLKNRIFFTSFSLGLASTIAILNPNSGIKQTGFLGVGSSIAGVVYAEILTGAMFGILRDSKEEIEGELKERIGQVSDLQRSVDKTINELAALKIIKSGIQDELTRLTEIVKDRDHQLLAARTVTNQLQTKLATIGKFSATNAYEIVRNTYQKSVKKLEALLDALSRNYPVISEDLETIYQDVDKFQNRYQEKLKNYETIESFDELLDTGLSLQETIIDKCVELKVKAQSVVIRYLDSIVLESVPFTDYETHIQNLTHKAAERIEEIKIESELNEKAIAQEWVESNAITLQNYSTEFDGILTTAKYSVQRMQEMEGNIEFLKKRIEFLELPIKWRVEVLDGQKAGNKIIDYFKSRGILLDRSHIDNDPYEPVIYFHANRMEQVVTEDDLNKYSDVLQQHIELCLEPPHFTYNGSLGLFQTKLKLGQKPKKNTTQTDIDKIWLPASKFESYVKNWERIRITAGSTGGKSPTAKNLALAIMKSRKGVGEIRLYDPRHGSKKDYWNMPKAGMSHEQSWKGMNEAVDLVEQRGNSTGHEFKLYIFDEVDNTVIEMKKGNEFKEVIKKILKEGSHGDIGAIFIGQSVDANEIPGMTHSNWNNACGLHIGSNAGLVIDRLETIPTEQKTRLLEQYAKIQEYCDRKNDELGLDIYTDPTAYRFALAVPLTGLPKLIQLPDFDAYDYYEVMTTNDVTPINPNWVEVQPETLEPLQKITCACGSDNLIKKGKSATGKQQYQCKDCGKKSSV